MVGQSKYRLFRLFRSEQFDNQTKRILGHAVYDGALPGEVFSVIPRIRNGDFESWYEQWIQCAEQTMTLANSANDPLSRGRALLRAANYFRSAMFFLSPAETPYDMRRAAAPYTLRDVHERIGCDVLALRGADDIYGPGQASLFRAAFPNARSYAFVEYARNTGASEHCQIGSVEQAAQTIVSWVRARGYEESVAIPPRAERVKATSDESIKRSIAAVSA